MKVVIENVSSSEQKTVLSNSIIIFENSHQGSEFDHFYLEPVCLFVPISLLRGFVDTTSIGECYKTF